MAEAAPVPTGFPVEVSGSVQDILRAHGLQLESDRLALDAMATHFGVQLPEDPRAVIIKKTDPHLPINDNLTMVLSGSGDSAHADMPAYDQEHDLLVILPYGLNQSTITAGLAHILLKKKQAEQSKIISRWGFGAVGLGTVGLGAGAAGAPGWAGTVGGIAFGAGASAVAFAHNRRPPRVPDITNLQPPITIVEAR